MDNNGRTPLKYPQLGMWKMGDNTSILSQVTISTTLLCCTLQVFLIRDRFWWTKNKCERMRTYVNHNRIIGEWWSKSANFFRGRVGTRVPQLKCIWLSIASNFYSVKGFGGDAPKPLHSIHSHLHEITGCLFSPHMHMWETRGFPCEHRSHDGSTHISDFFAKVIPGILEP